MNLDILKGTYLYNDLYEKFGEDFVVDAGYYDNGVNDFLEFNEKLLNFKEFIRRYKFNGKNALVYITGSFAPIHEGHINSGILACDRLKEEGYNVLGVILSPDHDRYVVDNKINRKDLNIHERISIINNKLDKFESEYPLICDMWNGLYNSTAINFTELTKFLLDGLKHFDMAHNTELFFVCGGDNARFAKTFVHKHGAVVIKRPGYDDEVKRVMREIDEINRDAKIFFCDGGMSISSTQVRNEAYKEILKYEKKDLYLKIEDDEIHLAKSIIPILAKHYNSVTPVYNDNLFLKFIKKFKEIDEKHNNYTIVCLDKKFYKFLKNRNLNKVIENIHCVDVSRVYLMNGIKKEGHKTHKLYTTLETIKNKNVIILDDDSVSGSTINFIKDILENEGFNVLDTVILNEPKSKKSEILDLGDLIFNNPEGGLVINDNKMLKRYPYVLPFVSPYDRCSVEDPIQFTLDIYEFNEKLQNGINIPQGEIVYNYLKNKK